MNKGLMTEGNVYKKILFFSIPLLFSNIFQILYNTVDSIVVGRYVGKVALAAVGASGPLINLLVSFFLGLSVGGGVVISRYFGGKKERELSLSVHTVVSFSLISGMVLTVLGVIFSKQILILMKTPFDVLNSAEEYLSIFFMGSIFLCVYNACTGILQSVGDSKRPLYFLGVSFVVNVILDLLFVNVFKMGVSGVAWATFIAQGVSCGLVIYVLMNTEEAYKVKVGMLKINYEILVNIVRIGVPAGLQGVIVSYSNVLVQSYVNLFGSAAIAGFSSALTFDSFVGMPINSFANTVTTFTGQNLGSKRFDRVKKGVRAALIMCNLSVLLLVVFFFIFANDCIKIFSDDPEVIKNGALIIRTLGPFHLVLSIHQILSGTIRASGRSVVPMIISVFCFVAVRQVFLSALMPVYNSILIVGLGYSVTWTLSALITLVYYYSSKWLEKDMNML